MCSYLRCQLTFSWTTHSYGQIASFAQISRGMASGDVGERGVASYQIPPVYYRESQSSVPGW